MLRSRWTVVALVPAFFLAGFGIVSALEDGSGDPDAVRAQPPAATDAGGPGITTVIGESDPAEQPPGNDPTSTTDAEDLGGSGGEERANAVGNRGTGDGGGGAGPQPPAPPSGEIVVDYGRWDGVFELESLEIQPDFGLASVFGALEYRGGVDCPIGLVRVKAWFFGERGRLAGTAVWESVQSTGEGGEVTGREPLPFEAYGSIEEEPASASLRFTAVECL